MIYSVKPQFCNIILKSPIKPINRVCHILHIVRTGCVRIQLFLCGITAIKIDLNLSIDIRFFEISFSIKPEH